MKTYPFVSICTPTYNRRPFVINLIQMVLEQDYPRENIEWIILDDGEDKVWDLFVDMPWVKYLCVKDKLPIGRKRNIMNKHSKGDIIVYMDDDDIYPPSRIRHAVDTLESHPEVLCCGCSKLYIYYTLLDEIIKFGPYHRNHATANTFAFKRSLLEITHFEDGALRAEEKYFLKNYEIPFAQLEPRKTILVVSHNNNTFDKRQIIKSGKRSRYTRDTYFTLSATSPKEKIIAEMNL